MAGASRPRGRGGISSTSSSSSGGQRREVAETKEGAGGGGLARRSMSPLAASAVGLAAILAAAVTRSGWGGVSGSGDEGGSGGGSGTGRGEEGGEAPDCEFQVVDGKDMHLISGEPIPLLLRGLPEIVASAEKAVGWAEPEAFRKRYGDVPVAVPDIELRAQLGHATAGANLTIGSWLDSLSQAEGGSTVEPFLFATAGSRLVPRLQRDGVFAVPQFLRELTFLTFVSISGRPGGTLPSHYHGATWAALAAGEKLWLVSPPGEKPVVPVGRAGPEKFDGQPGVIRCVQRASEVVVLPDGWWHATYGLSSWSVGYGGQGYWPIDETGLAALMGNGDAIRDVSQSDALSKYLLHRACRGGHPAVVRQLLGLGARADQIDPAGDSPMHAACSSGDEDVISMLLAHGPDLRVVSNGPGSEGMTALHVCSSFGHAGGVRLLLAARADPDASSAMAPDPNMRGRQRFAGATPLMHAALYGHAPVVAALLEAGARRGSKDEAGWTARRYAKKYGHKAVMDLLKSDKNGGQKTKSQTSSERLK